MTPEQLQPMKVIYFKRVGKGYATGFYVPNQDVVLYEKCNPAVDAPVLDEILETVRNIAQGKDAPENFRDVSVFEYDGSMVMALIQDAILRADLDKKVDAGIEKLLIQAKTKP